MVVLGNIVMMMTGVLALAATAWAGDACGSTTAPTTAPTPAPQPVGTPCSFAGETYMLLAANNSYLFACMDCMKTSDPGVMVAPGEAEHGSLWSLKLLENGRYTIQDNNVNLKFIGPSLDRAPGVIDPNQVMMAYDHSPASNVTEWTCRDIGGGKITLQNAYTGGYLSRCEGCQSSAQTTPIDTAFALTTPHGNQDITSQQWTYTVWEF